MKKREDMMRDVHCRIDEYKTEKKMKKAKTKRITAVVLPVCALAIIGGALWQGGALAPAKDPAIGYTASVLSSEEASDTQNKLPLITSYPSASASMATPEIGTCGYTMSLYDAMEEYKDRANYFVNVDIFRESGQVFDFEELAAEAERLQNTGYTAEIHTEKNQGEDYSYITLKASYNQLKDFPVKANYGYAFRLHDN